MTTLLSPGRVELDALQTLFWKGGAVQLDPTCDGAIERAAQHVNVVASGKVAVYGVNTGFGKLAHVRISPERVADLQKNLIRSHACGVGPPLAPQVVRLVLTLKLMSLGRGASGVRLGTVRLLEAFLAQDILPVIPAQGSVGASGDLAPLAHMAVSLMGEGEVTYRGTRMPSARALERAGLSAVSFAAKEGLALINGTQVSTALALAGLFRAHRAIRTALVTGALSTDAAMGSSGPFHPAIHELRGQPGQIDTADALRGLLEGSQIRDSHRDGDERVQDPYCLRCQPQVAGACLDVVRYVAQTLMTEANAVTDNPLVLESGEIVSGGNFHAEPVAFAADQLALAIAEIGAISQRRIALLVDPALSFGLPPFLSPDPGLNSGLMMADVVSAALMSENKQRAAPASIDSTPTSANQEDHVSMACHGARRLLDMTDNLFTILGIEAITAAQGIDLRAPLRTSPELQRAHAVIRAHVDGLDEDRVLADDIATATELVRSGALQDAVAPTLLPTLQRSSRLEDE